MTAKQIAAVILAAASGTLCAAGAKGGFADAANRYLASHKVEGVGDANALMHVIGAPCGDAAAVDATVEPRHKARKVRCWGPNMLPFFERWGLDVAEFDPDAAARGDLPDVIFITQAPH